MIRTYAKPQEGYFKIRLVKGGPWVPASIFRPAPWEIHEEWWGTLMRWCDRWPALEAEVFGEEIEVQRVWEGGRPIPKSEYDFQRYQLRPWAEQHQPNHPICHPRRPIDLTKTEPVF